MTQLVSMWMYYTLQALMHEYPLTMLRCGGQCLLLYATCIDTTMLRYAVHWRIRS